MITKNKKILAVLTIVMVGALFGGILAVSVASDWSLGQEATPAPGASFYESAYAKATSEQKEELDKIIADKSIDLPGEWIRPVLIAIGDLPKDQPRLTAEQAGKIYDSIGKDVGALEREFNKIAGAPDFVGGSGIERSVYYLNDDRSQAIFLMLDDAILCTVNDDGIYNIRLPLGNQKLPVDPGPSIAPKDTPQTFPVPQSPTKAPAP
ncbi:hypothetical protein [Candidatus Bathycorpusculum sp.]|uniref:hypothetical protein n=1 Tax=Candidatus Bathycorpusculum sp. TaxID=2994959 RepID=UPI0028293764|nr:hypothetical protein [Candidatus Termitimicrobium sp.]MCL2685262.1 hypothetical protein [Candidatus Termitimicrobium sp.]